MLGIKFGTHSHLLFCLETLRYSCTLCLWHPVAFFSGVHFWSKSTEEHGIDTGGVAGLAPSLEPSYAVFLYLEDGDLFLMAVLYYMLHVYLDPEEKISLSKENIGCFMIFLDC